MPRGELQLFLDVREHDLLCDAIENHLSSWRQEREAVADAALELVAREPGQRAVLQIEAEVRVLEPHEVEHGENSLVLCAAESPPELLKEDCRGLRGPQHEDRVNHGDVEPLVEEVDGEQADNLAASQLGEPFLAFIGSGSASKGEGGEAGAAEHLCHVMGMLDADTESESPHTARVG